MQVAAFLHEQIDAELLLEQVNLPGNRGLGDVHLFRRLRDVLLPGDFNEILQLS
jgi:hypothetical protein